jgi:hypothetical protein
VADSHFIDSRSSRTTFDSAAMRAQVILKCFLGFRRAFSGLIGNEFEGLVGFFVRQTSAFGHFSGGSGHHNHRVLIGGEETVLLFTVHGISLAGGSRG